MNRELYFCDQLNPNLQTAIFDTFESQHLIKALRKGRGATIEFTDGAGNLYQGSIINTKPLVEVSYNILESATASGTVRSVLAIGFIRHNRMDFMIEKCTELGIDRFYLISSKFSNYYTSGTSRWQKIMRQAIKQSLRYALPEIITCSSFTAFISETRHINNKYLAEQEADRLEPKIMEKKNIKNTENILFAIGPEGGFDEEEQHTALSEGFIPVSFGNHRLRTETAAISAAAYINLFRKTINNNEEVRK